VRRDNETLPDTRRRDLLAAGGPGGVDQRALVEPLLRDTDSRTRVLALRVGAVHQWWTDEQWLDALRDEHEDVRREAAWSLARVNALSLVLTAELVIAIRDADALVADAAIFACGEHEERGAVETLIEVAAQHEDARCRESAVAALGAIGDDRAQNVIIAALGDKPPVRRRAVVALSNFEGPAVEAALEGALEDRDWQVRAAAEQLNGLD